MNAIELKETVKAMIEAPSCCEELQAAGKAYLDAIGTADEKSAYEAMLKEIQEDICMLEHTISFFESEVGAQIFGKKKADALAAHGRELQAKGEKWCFCDACAACLKILRHVGIEK